MHQLLRHPRVNERHIPPSSPLFPNELHIVHHVALLAAVDNHAEGNWLREAIQHTQRKKGEARKML